MMFTSTATSASSHLPNCYQKFVRCKLVFFMNFKNIFCFSNTAFHVLLKIHKHFRFLIIISSQLICEYFVSRKIKLKTNIQIIIWVHKGHTLPHLFSLTQSVSRWDVNANSINQSFSQENRSLSLPFIWKLCWLCLSLHVWMRDMKHICRWSI